MDASSVADLRSQHTENFPTLLAKLNISLAVSTYQAGKLILLREQDGVINTHFRNFERPMGLAIQGQQLALGSRHRILQFRNVPQVSSQLDSLIPHDACYLPAQSHVTGEIDGHELAYVQSELWLVNTQFSCLCTLDPLNSFVPRWRPPFISGYALGDRCHLNGLAVRDDQARYVTALGQSNEKGGWRENKANGGLLMDTQSNDIILDRLSMPHSPRWYQDNLWFLESGYGSLSKVNLDERTKEPIALMPGFTRGCAFCGDFAFVGLSKVRESSTFSGLPLTKTLEERICGVWVIQISTGQIVAYLKFLGDVEEIFAVEVLPHCRYPDIMEWDSELQHSAYVLPDGAFAEVDDAPITPNLGLQQFEQGNIQYQRGELQAAIASYRNCLSHQPSYLPARFNLGVALGDAKCWDEAIIELERVITDDVGHAEAHNSLAFVNVQLGQLEKAAFHYEKALKIKPNYTQAKQNFEQLRQWLKP